MAGKRRPTPKKRSTAGDAPDDVRVKRPRLQRTEPIRSWSALFGAGRSGQSPPGAGSAGAQSKATDPISRGVEMGYRVIDDYVRQGAAVAGSFVNGGQKPGAGPDLSQMADRMMRYATDFSSAWLEAMSMMASTINPGASEGRAPASSGADRNTGAPNSAGSRNGDLRVSIDVRSDRPAEVFVNLEGSSSGETLEVEPMRARSGKAVLRDVAVELPTEPGGTVRIKVHVPAGCKAERYTGAIIEAKSKRPRGRLTVVLAP
jgi:hypothetical protein